VFAVASVNYGDVPADAEKALAGSCPIVGSFGARDAADSWSRIFAFFDTELRASGGEAAN